MTDLPENDLKLVNGIGPSFEGKLKDLGIATLTDLAARTDARDIAELIGSRGVDEEVVQNWIAQAQNGGAPIPEPSPTEEPEPTPVAPAVAAKANEPTLHDLNLRAREIDRQHRAEIDAARAAAEEAMAKILKTAAMPNPDYRRTQKDLRPLPAGLVRRGRN